MTLKSSTKWGTKRLSRMHSPRKNEDVEALVYAISIIQPDWIAEAKDEWENDEKIWTFIQKLQQDPSTTNTFRWKDEFLWYTDRLYLGKSFELKKKVLSKFHSSLIRGHSSFLKTYHMVKKYFFWDGLKTGVQKFVVECLVSNKIKWKQLRPLVSYNHFPFQVKCGHRSRWILS